MKEGIVKFPGRRRRRLVPGWFEKVPGVQHRGQRSRYRSKHTGDRLRGEDQARTRVRGFQHDSLVVATEVCKSRQTTRDSGRLVERRPADAWLERLHGCEVTSRILDPERDQIVVRAQREHVLPTKQRVDITLFDYSRVELLFGVASVREQGEDAADRCRERGDIDADSPVRRRL